MMELQIKREDTEKKSCSNCDNFTIFYGDVGLCRVHRAIKKSSYSCPQHKFGVPAIADIDEIAYWYQFFKEVEEEAKMYKDLVRECIVSIAKETDTYAFDTSRFIVTVEEAVSKRIDTAKLKKAIDVSPFLKVVRYTKVTVKRR